MKRFGRYGCGGLLAVAGLFIIIGLFSPKSASPSGTPTFTPTKTPLPAIVNRSLQVVISPTVELLPTLVVADTPIPVDTPTPVTVAPMAGITIDAANLRDGPGTNYAIAGAVVAGQTITIINKNEAGDWYQLDSKAWIAAFLVDTSGQRAESPTENPVTSAPAQPVQLEAAPPPTQANAPATGGSECVDGTHSNSTGRGACSHHGGVKH